MSAQLLPRVIYHNLAFDEGNPNPSHIFFHEIRPTDILKNILNSEQMLLKKTNYSGTLKELFRGQFQINLDPTNVCTEERRTKTVRARKRLFAYRPSRAILSSYVLTHWLRKHIPRQLIWTKKNWSYRNRAPHLFSDLWLTPSGKREKHWLKNPDLIYIMWFGRIS